MAHFLYVGNLRHDCHGSIGAIKKVKNSIAQVTELVEPTIHALGLDLWGIEHIQQGRFSLLRIYIECEQGVTIEHCEQVSRQVSALLDVEDPITGEYTLEVSSPGMDRPLFSARQFAKFAGSEVKLRTRSPIEGRRKFRGTIVKVDGDSIRLHVDGIDFDLAHSDVEKANIVY